MNVYDFLGRELYNVPDPKVAKIIKENIKLIGNNVLDLCCGTGRYSCLLSELGASVIGIDTDKKSIEQAKRKETNARFICENIKDFSTKEKFSAVVLLGNSVPHFSIQDLNVIIAKYKNSTIADRI